MNNLTSQLNNIPKDTTDLNNIGSLLYSQYTGKVSIINALSSPISAMQVLMQQACSAISVNGAFDVIMNNMAILDAAAAQGLTHGINSTLLHTDILSALSLVIQNNPNIISSLPSSLVNLALDVENDVTTSINNHVLMPSDMVSNLQDQAAATKETALKNMMGGYYNTIILPFYEYNNYLNANTIAAYISDIRAVETTLMNNIFLWTADNFIEPISRTLWSNYYSNYFMLNNAEIFDPSFLTTNATTLSEIHALLTRLSAYRNN